MNRFSEVMWRTLFNCVFKGYYGLKVFGRDSFPKEGAVIVAPNHASNFDPPLVGTALPRHISFMAKEELFRNFFLRTIITWLGAFPVNRKGVDKIAIRRAMDILKKGNLLGIFPEGTRRKPGHLGPFHDGAASLALRTGTPIVPVAIIGSDTMRHNKIVVALGLPIEVNREKATVEAVNRVNDQIREAITALHEKYKTEAE